MKLIIDIHEKDYQSMLNGYISYGLLDAIKNGTPLDEIKTEIEKQHTATSSYGVDDFLYGKHQAYGNCLDIIDKHVNGKETK